MRRGTDPRPLTKIHMNTPDTRRPPGASRRELILLAAVTAAGLAVRLALWSTQSIVSVDGTVYIRLARALAGGPSFESVQPPGYPMLILLFHAVLRDWILAARAVDLTAGTALIPLTWLLARAYIARPWLRLGPALAVAALPLTVHYSLTTMSEAPYLAVLLLAFILVSRRHWFPGGIAFGLAYLIRPEALLVAAALALFGLRRPRRAGRLVGGVLLVVVPFVILQGAQTGVWTLSAKSANIGGDRWWKNEPVAADSAAPGAAPTTGERISHHWRESLGAYPRRLGVLGLESARHGGWVVPLLALPALAGPAGLLGAALVPILVLPVFALGGHSRFVLPLLPFVWILAGAFLDRLRPRAAIPVAAIAALGLAATAWTQAPVYHRNEDGIFPELVEAGRWLRPHVTPETEVYGRKPYTAFYAGASFRVIPLGTYDEILDAIVRDGGDYLVVDQAVANFFRPQLLPLVLDKAVIWNDPRLAPVYVNRTYKDRTTLVYRVIRPGGPPPLPGEKAIKTEIGEIDHGPNHFFHGILAMRKERWTVAAGEFAYAVLRDSTNTVAMNNRAWCLLQAGRFLEDAEQTAKRAVDLEPANLDYLDTLIEVLDAENKPEEAAIYRSRVDSLTAAGSPGSNARDE